MIEKAVKLGGHRSKKAAVMEALSEYIHSQRAGSDYFRCLGQSNTALTITIKKQRAKA
jgi:hypothetical protein